MTIHSLIYISVNLIAPGQLAAEVARIIDSACVRNASLGITGALIASQSHLAQYLEGPADAVGDLLRRIEKDIRHTQVTVIQRGTRPERLFPQWDMAYAGESVFVRRRLAEMFQSAPDGRFTQAEQLIDLMREFTKGPR